MKRFQIIATGLALSVSLGLGGVTPSLAMGHDQGIGDGSGLNRPLTDLGTSNTGGTGVFKGGPGSLGISEQQKDGIRGGTSSAAGSDNSGAHGSVAGSVDDVVGH